MRKVGRHGLFREHRRYKGGSRRIWMRQLQRLNLSENRAVKNTVYSNANLAVGNFNMKRSTSFQEQDIVAVRCQRENRTGPVQLCVDQAVYCMPPAFVFFSMLRNSGMRHWRVLLRKIGVCWAGRKLRDSVASIAPLSEFMLP